MRRMTQKEEDNWVLFWALIPFVTAPIWGPILGLLLRGCAEIGKG